MPRPNPKAPGQGQDSLFADPTTKDSLRIDGGRHTQSMRAAIGAAAERELLEDVDKGIATVLLAGAYSLDQFEAQNKPYGPTKLISQMVEALQAAHMTPDSRDTGIDESVADLIEALSDADAADPEPVVDNG